MLNDFYGELPIAENDAGFYKREITEQHDLVNLHYCFRNECLHFDNLNTFF